MTSIQREGTGEIRSPALCRALFDLYLSAKPISGRAKKTVISRFPQVLAGVQETPGSQLSTGCCPITDS